MADFILIIISSLKSVVFAMHCDTDKRDVFMGCVYNNYLELL